MSSTITEYICEDCGSTLFHENPTTFQSIKEVHSQLCPVKRQKILANAEAEKLKKLASERVATPILSTQTASNAGPQIAVAAEAVTTSVGGGAKGVSLSGDTTISLTGSGTGHSTAEGPIDIGFKSKRQPVGKFKGIEVWGPYDAPGQIGVWGTDVCVDFDICIADGACIDACPVNVYEWLDTPGHPSSEKKPFMIREKDCIFCLACENVCPPQAIKIFVKK
ncbi:MAG: 4Fe-4S dicluster domain-containing protein [Candidatus Nitrosocosmicus sp.]